MDLTNFEENNITVNRTSSYTRDFGIYEDTTKTEYSNRTSYVPKFITAMINKYREVYEKEKLACGDKWNDSNRIFTQWNGNPMSPDVISKWFPKFIRKYELKYTSFHGLRHAHGSILLALGHDPASVADQLGHSNLQMLLSTYGHNIRKNNKDIADSMKEVLLDE